MSQIEPAEGHGDKVLVLAHRQELISQAYNKIKQAYPDKIVAIEMAKQVPCPDAEIIVASVASIKKPDRLKKYNPKDYKLIIIDETHHAASKTYLAIQKHFGADSSSSPVAVAGFSATMSRHDGIGLACVLDHIVYHKELIDMIREGHLCDMKITVVSTDANLSEVSTSSTGDFSLASLSQVVNTDSLNQLVVNTWKLHSNGGRTYKRTLIFGVDVAHVAAMVKRFEYNGIVAKMVSGNTNLFERRKIIDDFSDGKIPVLINCGIFTEGTDIPAIDQIILNRPTKSKGLLVQMVGRGLRNHQGKTHCHVIDMVGNLSKGTMVTVPTLAGLDPYEVMVERSCKQALETVSEDSVRDIKISKVEFTSYSNILHFAASAYSSDQILKRIQATVDSHRYYNWLTPGGGDYILPGITGYLRLYTLRSKDGCPPTFRLVRFLKSGFTRSGYTTHTMANNEPDLERVLNLAEKYARTKFGIHFVARNSPWREQSMTESQAKAVQNAYRRGVKDGEFPEGLKSLNKGEAFDLLTLSSVTQGAIFRKFKEQTEKRQKRKSRPRRSDHGVVKVGPIDPAVGTFLDDAPQDLPESGSLKL